MDRSLAKKSRRWLDLLNVFILETEFPHPPGRFLRQRVDRPKPFRLAAFQPSIGNEHSKGILSARPEGQRALPHVMAGLDPAIPGLS